MKQKSKCYARCTSIYNSTIHLHGEHHNEFSEYDQLGKLKIYR